MLHDKNPKQQLIITDPLHPSCEHKSKMSSLLQLRIILFQSTIKGYQEQLTTNMHHAIQKQVQMCHQQKQCQCNHAQENSISQCIIKEFTWRDFILLARSYIYYTAFHTKRKRCTTLTHTKALDPKVKYSKLTGKLHSLPQKANM